MAVYYSIRCPHCNFIVESGKNRKKQWGSPLKICPACGKIYVDDNFEEPAFFDKKQIKWKNFRWGALYWATFGIISFCLGIGILNVIAIIAGMFLAVSGIIAIIVDLKYNPDADEVFQQELNLSKSRISDNYYIIALVKAGCCNIPREIFNNAKNALNLKSKAEIYIEKMQSDDYDETRYLCKSFKFLSDSNEGKCFMCYKIDILKKYRIKNEVGTRDICICSQCITRFNKHNISNNIK